MREIKLYGFSWSPPVRAVKLTANALGIDVKFIETNPLTGATFTPEFLAMNPYHCVPTIQDGDFALWESRPIMVYLSQKYGKDSGIYPDCPVKRAHIDRLLHFDMGTLYQRFLNYVNPFAFDPETGPPNPAKYQRVVDGIGLLDNELEGKKYLIGDSFTVADCSLCASVTAMETSGFPMDDFKNVSAWLARCKAWEHYTKDIREGAEECGKYILSKLPA